MGRKESLYADVLRGLNWETGLLAGLATMATRLHEALRRRADSDAGREDGWICEMNWTQRSITLTDVSQIVGRSETA